jgi:Tol biopolymer transport system component
VRSVLVLAATLSAFLGMVPVVSGRVATERVSVNDGGVQGNGRSPSGNEAGRGIAMSADARVVAFSSDASNLIDGDWNGAPDIFVRDRLTGTTVPAGPYGIGTAVSADGRAVAFVTDRALLDHDTNEGADVYVRDLVSSALQRVSVKSGGGESMAGSVAGPPALSADGAIVAFASSAPDLVAGDVDEASDVFVHDRRSGATTRVAPNSEWFAMSADGRLVAFVSFAAELTGSTSRSGVFVHDRVAGRTSRISIGGYYGSVRISADGRVVAFDSTRRRLVTGLQWR